MISPTIAGVEVSSAPASMTRSLTTMLATPEPIKEVTPIRMTLMAISRCPIAAVMMVMPINRRMETKATTDTLMLTKETRIAMTTQKIESRETTGRTRTRMLRTAMIVKTAITRKEDSPVEEANEISKTTRKERAIETMGTKPISLLESTLIGEILIPRPLLKCG